MELQLTLSLEDFPAKTSALQVEGRDSQGNAQVSGGSSIDSSKRSSRSSSSLKMSQPFVLGDWTKYSGASLKSGMMRNGIVFPLASLGPGINGTESGYLPTPHDLDNQGCSKEQILRQSHLSAQLTRGFEKWPGRSNLRESRLSRNFNGVPGQVDRTKQLGNAVVPQIPELIGKAIIERISHDQRT